MKTIDQYNFSGKKALIRVDFNVPLNEKYEITDDTRLKAALPTIKKILDDGGSVILMSHLGRPKQGPEEKFSLKHVVPYLSEKLNVEVQFADDCVGESAKEKAASLKGGDVLILENVRFYKEETKGDEDFAKKLASLGDVYVNDAFGSAHRAHASTTIAAKFFDDKFAGYVMQAELDNAKKVLEAPERPFTAIMGGAKISDKIQVIENLLDKVDNLLIGGGMSYTFFKAMGGKIGSSLVEEDKLDLANQLIKKAKEKGVELKLPVDSIIADKFDNDANTKVAQNNMIDEGWMGLDIGPEATEVFKKTIEESKTILWNGPMGIFEIEDSAKGTFAIAETVAKSGATSIIGGGDSVTAIKQSGYGEEVSFISTGGGASLELLEGKTLPGVAVLSGDQR